MSRFTTIVARDGTVWIARYAALSLTAFNPVSATFTEHPLPTTAGDPAKLVIGPEGHIIFTTDLSADHPGYIYERVGEYDPVSGQAQVYAQPARALAVTGQGDLYTVMDGPSNSQNSGQAAGLARLSAGARASALAPGQAPAFTRGGVPFAVDGAALATDRRGRVWMAIAGQPKIAVFDPATGLTQQFQYAAPSVVAYPVHGPLGTAPRPADANAVQVVRMAAMVTDSEGHLWYVRAGSDVIEEVAA